MRFWMNAAILTVCGVMNTVLTSCGKADEPLAPEKDPKQVELDKFSTSMVGVFTDFNEADEGVSDCYGVYEILADGNFDTYILSNSGDPENPFLENYYHGKWRASLDIKDRWTNGEPLKAIIVDYDEMEIDGEKYLYSDTLLVVDDENGDRDIIWADDLDFLMEYLNNLSPEELAALGLEVTTTRGIGSWLMQKVLDIKNNVVKIVNVVAKPFSDVVRIIKGKNVGRASGLSDWMGSIYNGKDPKVCDMSIPGTHDSFTYEFFGLDPIMTRKVKTQGLNIENQWDAGIRCFDVRLDYRTQYDGLGVMHGNFYTGIKFVEALDMIAKQVVAHKNEMAIVVLKFEDDESEADYQRVHNEVDKLRKQGLVVENPSPEMRLSQCRGKILFIQRYKSNKYNLDVRAAGWNENSELVFMNADDNKAKLYVQDIFESNGDEVDIQFYNRKKAGMRQCFQKAAESFGSGWFINHESAYFGISVFADGTKYLGMNYAEVANEMNPWAADYVNDHKGKKTGIVMMDFGGIDQFFWGCFYTRGIDLPVNIVDNNNYL